MRSIERRKGEQRNRIGGRIKKKKGRGEEMEKKKDAVN